MDQNSLENICLIPIFENYENSEIKNYKLYEKNRYGDEGHTAVPDAFEIYDNEQYKWKDYWRE